MKYRYFGKDFKYKNREFGVGIQISNFKSICIKYFHHDNLIMKDFFSEPEGNEYLKKFYIDLWIIRFEIEMRTSVMGLTKLQKKQIGDGSEVLARTGNNPFREEIK